MEYEEIEAVFAGKTLDDLLAMRDYLVDDLLEPIEGRIKDLWEEVVCEKGQCLTEFYVSCGTAGLHATCILAWSYDRDNIRGLEIMIPYETVSDRAKCSAFFQAYKEHLQAEADALEKRRLERERVKKVADLHRLQKELGIG